MCFEKWGKHEVTYQSANWRYKTGNIHHIQKWLTHASKHDLAKEPNQIQVFSRKCFIGVRKTCLGAAQIKKGRDDSLIFWRSSTAKLKNTEVQILLYNSPFWNQHRQCRNSQPEDKSIHKSKRECSKYSMRSSMTMMKNGVALKWTSTSRWWGS